MNYSNSQRAGVILNFTALLFGAYEFTVDEVEIDVMAGFVIVENNIEHDCSLKSDQIVEYIIIGGESVPLQGLSLWRQYYEWMGRKTKVELIDSSLQGK